MQKLLLTGAAAAALLLTACEPTTSGDAPAMQKTSLPAGIAKIETSTANAGEIAIPYSKYELANGLTIVLHEDKSDPLVHVDITYHVGSGREDIGRSGFAHFFEHMMFQGSDNVADEQHFGLITESGGTLNGSTNSDRTNYYETVPSNQLERMLWLEADRMGFFLDAVTQKKFENQRETVKNERGQRYDNRPYGLLWERTGEALFPEGHPYSWSTIGYLEDLDRATLADLKKFFLRWYGPNNAVLTIGGDIDKAETLKLVKKYFGGIPRGPEVNAPEYTQVRLTEDRYISMEDNVSLPLIRIAIPTVKLYHEDEAPLDVLMSILGSGKTSLLYKNLVKPGKAVQASAGHGCRELSCEFSITALPTPGNSLADLEKIARASLAEFETRGGATDDDIERVKSGIVSGMIYGLESVSGKVSQLAQYETFRGNPDYIKDDIARYENVTKDDVMRVYQKYIKNGKGVVMSIVPKGQPEAIAKADSWERYERTIPEYPETTLELRPGTSDFDRSVIPAPGANPVIKTPEIFEGKVGNIPMIGAVNSEVPTTTLYLDIPAGQSREPLEKLGLAALTAAMMGEATQSSTAEDLSNRLQKLGSTVSFNASNSETSLYVRSLTKNLDETLAIAREKLTEPKFAQDDFDRLKKQTIEGIKNAKKYPSQTATNVFTKLLFGADNSFAYPDDGMLETVEALTLDDVKQFYAQNYGSGGADIVMVSDLGRLASLKALGTAFANWKGSTSEEPAMKPYPELAAGTLYFIDKPDAAQSEIRIGKRGPHYDALGEHYKSYLMNYNLGGAFNSRINLNLREDKGYTYGARSFFYGTDYYGGFRAQAGVRANATVDSIQQFVNEIGGFHSGGMTDKEMSFLKNAIGQSEARKYETPRQKLGVINRISTYNLPKDYTQQQNKILQAATKEELDALATKHLDLSEMIIVVVGDKKSLWDDIKAMGYPVVELDADGNAIGG